LALAEHSGTQKSTPRKYRNKNGLEKTVEFQMQYQIFNSQSNAIRLLDLYYSNKNQLLLT